MNRTCVDCGDPARPRRGNDGPHPKRCEPCQRVADLERYRKYGRSMSDDMRKRRKQRTKEWARNNTEWIADYGREWRKRNPEKWRKYRRETARRMRRARPMYRVHGAVSSGINASLQGRKNTRKWQELVGYTLENLRGHLEDQFAPNMTWENYGMWHIDHIRPVSSFTFKSPDDSAFKECWSLENLQPLWAEDNMKKGTSYTPKQATRRNNERFTA